MKQGDLVRSTIRGEKSQLFIMVLHDPTPSDTQFNGVIIKDMGERGDGGQDRQPGYVDNSWNTDKFDECTWEEVKPYL